MTISYSVRALAALPFLLIALPAAAQDRPPAGDTGAYAVLRAGIQTDADLRVRREARPAALPRNTDLGSGFTGSAGVGYDLGGVRFEGTMGLTRGGIDGKRLKGSNGRLRSLDFDLAGYVYLARGPIRPFVGAGVGVAVSPTTTIELAARYQRISGLRFGGGGADIRSRLAGTSPTLGLRQAF